MFLSRRAFVLCVSVCLSAALLFTACSSDGDDGGANGGADGLDPRLIGSWVSSFDEKYTIAQNNLSYESEYSSWGGQIVHAASFNDNTGVLIIRYDAGKKQQWTNWDTMEDITPAGKDFYGIYFRQLAANSVVLSNTSDLANNWGPSETATLADAVNRFAFDNMADWVDLGFVAPFGRVQ